MTCVSDLAAVYAYCQTIPAASSADGAYRAHRLHHECSEGRGVDLHLDSQSWRCDESIRYGHESDAGPMLTANLSNFLTCTELHMCNFGCAIIAHVCNSGHLG